jgi:hypothetical protein
MDITMVDIPMFNDKISINIELKVRHYDYDEFYTIIESKYTYDSTHNNQITA